MSASRRSSRNWLASRPEEIHHLPQALQAQKFERIEGLITLLGQQSVDANNKAAAERAAVLRTEEAPQ